MLDLGRFETMWPHLVIALLSIAYFAQRLRVRRSAKRILSQQKAIYAGKMERVEVRPHDFPQLNLAYYDDASTNMSRAGFRWLGDYECLTVTRAFPNMRTFIRCFVGDDGTITVGVYHIRPRGWMRPLTLLGIVPRNIYAFEFETEFADGTFLVTNNLAGQNRMAACPGFLTFQHAPHLKPEDLLKHHREQLLVVCSEKGIEPLRVRSREELWASQDRGNVLKSEYRKSRGYLTREDFEAIAGRTLKSEDEKLVSEFETQRDKEQKGG